MFNVLLLKISANIGITGTLTSKPTKWLNAILHLLPPNIYAKYSITCFALHFKATRRWTDRFYGHSQIFEGKNNHQLTIDLLQLTAALKVLLIPINNMTLHISIRFGLLDFIPYDIFKVSWRYPNNLGVLERFLESSFFWFQSS